MVYQEVNLQNDPSPGRDIHPNVITVSVDEKPRQYKSIGWNYEYKRLETVSILAALSLHSGKILAQVHELLKKLDDYYPKKSPIHIVLDNHSAHVSKETMKFLNLE